MIGESITVYDAREVFLYWSAATTFRVQAAEGIKDTLRQVLVEKLEKAASERYETLLARHVADYRSYYDRMSLTLESDCEPEQKPTDQCLEALSQGRVNTDLEQLYFNFGRYLMISSSRPGTLPAALQGLWNKDMEAPWDAKYTININTEMNYWLAEPCDLGTVICLFLICWKGCFQMAGGRRRLCMAAVVLWRITIPTSGETPHRRICGFPAASG